MLQNLKRPLNICIFIIVAFLNSQFFIQHIITDRSNKKRIPCEIYMSFSAVNPLLQVFRSADIKTNRNLNPAGLYEA